MNRTPSSAYVRFDSARARRKRGMFFTLDAVFGSMIIIAAVVLWLTFSQSSQDPLPLQRTATDGINVLTTMHVSDLNLATVSLLPQVLATNLTDGNDSVLRAIGVLWATNNSLAGPFTAQVLSAYLPRYSYAVYAEGDLLATRESKPEADATRIATAKQQISGIAYSKPITGTTGTAFLKKIENKTTSSFVTFGGFVGQGNITAFLTDLPSDLDSTRVRDVLLELDTPSPFRLFINGTDCGYFIPSNPLNTSIEQWTIMTCHDQFRSPTTLIEIRFNGSIDTSYISGGFLRVRYTTNLASDDPYESPKRVYLPGIQGVVNLYDAFSVPGNVSNITIHLHYLANHTGALASNPFYLTIGNTTVYRENFSNTTQSVTLTNVNLTPLLNYSRLSSQTVPFRIGFENLSFAATLTGDANVMVVTDVSGSMAWRMDADNQAGVTRSCADLLLNDSDTARISVAKCLDKQFAFDILNVTGNLLGLVSYEDNTVTAATVPLTTNITRVNSTINTYAPLDSTCICCGINSAVAELNRSVTRTTYIASLATQWRYNYTNGTTSAPANDSAGRPWYAVTYNNESSWRTGQAVLGASPNGTGPAITTDMGNSSSTNQLYPNLWENWQDQATPQADFTHAPLNTTGNTFGIAGANDGWDWEAGTYGFTPLLSQIGWRNVTGGVLRIDLNTSGNRNNCASTDCSAAYGLLLNITPAMYDTIQNNGYARITFSYSWIPNTANVFASQDEVWIKSRWTRPGGSPEYFGSELSNQGGDTTPEVARGNNPQNQFSGTFTTELTPMIDQAGMYYFDFGGKLYTNTNNSNKWGAFTFDNLLISITNNSDVYYVRKNFTVNNLSNVQTGILNLLSDDRATVYLNGQLLLDESLAHEAEYWNVGGFTIPQSAFVQGTNVLAVRLENFRGAAQFDARLQGINISKSLAMLVMTDGQAKEQCAEQGTGDDLLDTIKASCMAKQNWGITVNTVGFSSAADSVTLESAAVCGGGAFASSANTSELTDFYKNLALNILDSTVKSQSILLSGAFQQSILFNDSYFSFEHVPAFPSPLTNEITVRTQSPPLAGCNPTVYLNPTARVLSAQVTSYSGDHWTDLVRANGNTVYNLSSYNAPYIILGDPYLVDIPPNTLVPGTNTLLLRTGDSPTNSSTCSANNSLITTLGIQLSTAYTPVLTQANGCTWRIEHDDITSQVISVPKTYAGSNLCNYTNTSMAYNPNDAYDVATFNLLRTLDYDSDGRIFISLDAEDIEIIVNTISQVPYLWGPSLFEVRVWQ